MPPPVVPGLRVWAPLVAICQCERGGRSTTSIYALTLILYAALDGSGLCDEAATASLVGCVAATISLLVRIAQECGAGMATASLLELVLQAFGAAGVCTCLWSLALEASAPRDAFINRRVALAALTGAGPALLVATATRLAGVARASGGEARLLALAGGLALWSVGALEATPARRAPGAPERLKELRETRRLRAKPRARNVDPGCLEPRVIGEGAVDAKFGVSRNALAATPALCCCYLIFAVASPPLVALGSFVGPFSPADALAEGVLLAATPVVVALGLSRAAGNGAGPPWWLGPAWERAYERLASDRGGLALRAALAAAAVAAEHRLRNALEAPPATAATFAAGAAAAACACAAAALATAARRTDDDPPGPLAAPLCFAGLGAVFVGAAPVFLALGAVEVAGGARFHRAVDASGTAAAAAFLAVASRAAGPAPALAVAAPLLLGAATAGGPPWRTQWCAVAAGVGATWARVAAASPVFSGATVAGQVAAVVYDWRRPETRAFLGPTAALLVAAALGDGVAAAAADFSRGPALGAVAALLVAPASLLDDGSEAKALLGTYLGDAVAPKGRGEKRSAVALALSGGALLVFAPTQPLFRSLCLAAWASSARVALALARVSGDDDAVDARLSAAKDGAEAVAFGAAVAAVYLLHDAEASLLVCLRLICLAGALKALRRDDRAAGGALVALAVEAPGLLGSLLVAASLGVVGAASQDALRSVKWPAALVAVAAAAAALARAVADAPSALPLFAAAAAACAVLKRRERAAALESNLASTAAASRAAAVGDAAAAAAYGAAAALAAQLAAAPNAPKLLARFVVLAAAPVLSLLQRDDDLDAALPAAGGGPGAVARLADDARNAAPVLAPALWLVAGALATASTALEVVAVLLALAGPAALARAATARRAVDLALVAWPLTLAPFALYDCRLDAKLLGAVGCAGATLIALLFEDPKEEWE